MSVLLLYVYVYSDKHLSESKKQEENVEIVYGGFMSVLK